jgi:hypothetical protein
MATSPFLDLISLRAGDDHLGRDRRQIRGSHTGVVDEITGLCLSERIEVKEKEALQ